MAQEHSFRVELCAAWVAFARDGNPGTSALPEWPTYDPARRATLRFDIASSLVEDPAAGERVLWEGIR